MQLKFDAKGTFLVSFFKLTALFSGAVEVLAAIIWSCQNYLIVLYKTIMKTIHKNYMLKQTYFTMLIRDFIRSSVLLFLINFFQIENKFISN